MFLECGLARTGSAVAQLRMYVLHSLPSDLWFVFDLCRDVQTLPWASCGIDARRSV